MSEKGTGADVMGGVLSGVAASLTLEDALLFEVSATDPMDVRLARLVDSCCAAGFCIRAAADEGRSRRRSDANEEPE